MRHHRGRQSWQRRRSHGRRQRPPAVPARTIPIASGSTSESIPACTVPAHQRQGSGAGTAGARARIPATERTRAGRDAAEGRGDRLPTKEEVAGAGGGGDFTARASGPGSLARETGAARLCLGDLAEAADGRAHGGGRRRVHRVRAARNLRRRHGSALIEIELG